MEERQCVGKFDHRHHRPKFVIAVGTPTEDLESEINLRGGFECQSDRADHWE